MRKTLLLAALGSVPMLLSAQTAMDAYNASRSDLKGTARFMSMGGAFGALGGDLSTLSQNPGGIGVYRSSEIGFTLDLDCQHSASESQGFRMTDNQTKFLLNNIGGVATLRLGSSVCPNINLGFTYNKAVSFNRRYAGVVPQLSNSLSNYIAGIANANELTVGDVQTSDNYDPYNPNDGGYQAPWLSILGYDSYLISPVGNRDYPQWVGQWSQGTSGVGSFSVQEQGGVDEYNIAIGGNISNTVYWGMNFDITGMNYTRDSYWGESLQNAVIDNDGSFENTASDWNLHNYYHLSGTGFKYSIGVIVKPIQELRIGLAFHTPTWYNLTESFYAATSCNYSAMREGAVAATTNNREMAYNDFSLRTPCKLTASLAGVIGGRFIISADYEWQPYHAMHIGERSYSYYDGGYWGDDYYDDGWWGWGAPAKTQAPKATRASVYEPYYYENQDIKEYFTSTNTLRLGAEMRVTNQFSVRAGYSFVSSPVKERVRDNQTMVATGLTPSYQLDNTTNYVTCGLGYRIKAFSVDLAYVYKHQSASFHAYPSDPESPSIPSPQSKLSLDNSQVVLSCGLRF